MDHKKKKFLGLATRLEDTLSASEAACMCDEVVDVALRLRNMLSDGGLSLTRREKVSVLKSITRAKVRAFMSGDDDASDTFRTLDSISSDVVRLL